MSVWYPALRALGDEGRYLVVQGVRAHGAGVA